jgi:hypothetical protein
VPGGAGAELSDEVSTQVVVDDGGATGRGRMTILRLHWRRSDPLAVSLLITAQPDHPALPRGSWVVLRDFLRYGIEEPTGDGDVRIRPDATGRKVVFELSRIGKPATVSVPVDQLRDFLDATEQVVPAGEEASEAALDALIERLLER